ncbi:MAG TPA: hypothetical protein VN631_11190 [Negativicutes bacterium]|nr:hypothetical protein [Negativicutes bacterium]
MCSLFGIIDYKEALSQKWRNKAITVLSRESQIRGTDATGIAYNFNHQMRIFKRALPARKMQFRIPEGVPMIMGHTRMTTQGSAKQNYNNHPFPGHCRNTSFALAHNGVLYNDKLLRNQYHLPKTAIETDSYAAVQLLEQNNTLDLASLQQAAERVEGSFTFTVLDSNQTLSFIKGTSPLVISHFEQFGFYLYTSTEEIMTRVLHRLGISNSPHDTIKITCGDILQINKNGDCVWGKFNTEHLYQTDRFSYFSYWDFPYGLEYETTGRDNTPLDILLSSASAMGISPDDIALLLDCGYDQSDIEELLYDPMMMRECIAELKESFCSGWYC